MVPGVLVLVELVAEGDPCLLDVVSMVWWPVSHRVCAGEQLDHLDPQISG